MKKISALLAVMLPVIMFVSCRDEDKNTPELSEYETNVRKYVNIFLANMFSTYYLWNEEKADAIACWKLEDDPFEKLEEVRYCQSGKTVDRWSMVIDDYESVSASLAGTAETYGFSFHLYYRDSAKEKIYAVVSLVFADSPAAKAGLKRGDCIIEIAGKELTADNYSDVLSNDFYGKTSCSLKLAGGEPIALSKVKMYADPVILYKTFDCGSKKLGYLFYNDFFEHSYRRLIEVCKYFKNAGVKELILDLRYNGGGYGYIEKTLASMLAPEAAVTAKEVYEKNICNKIVGSSDDIFTTDFTTTLDGQTISYSTAGANIGISKIYAIVTGNTASASESIIGNLKAFMDVDVIGEQTYGKFCGGLFVPSVSFYDLNKDNLVDVDYEQAIKYSNNWGVYIMTGRYADRNGVTLSMPDGISPDYSVSDNPVDGYQLGDPNETMLAAALARAGYVPEIHPFVKPASLSQNLTVLPAECQLQKPRFGMLIMPSRYRRIVPYPELPLSTRPR